jgi:hypothetical protein
MECAQEIPGDVRRLHDGAVAVPRGVFPRRIPDKDQPHVLADAHAFQSRGESERVFSESFLDDDGDVVEGMVFRDATCVIIGLPRVSGLFDE